MFVDLPEGTILFADERHLREVIWEDRRRREKFLWMMEQGIEYADICPDDVRAAFEDGRLFDSPGNEEIWAALLRYYREIAEAEEKLRRVRVCAGKRWVRFLEEKRGG